MVPFPLIKNILNIQTQRIPKLTVGRCKELMDMDKQQCGDGRENGLGISRGEYEGYMRIEKYKIKNNFM